MPTAPSTSLPSHRRRGKRAALRRRASSLKHRLRESRKRTRAATGAAVLATIAALFFAFQPEPAPGPVPLGQGRAGVFTVADRGDAPARPASEAPAAEADDAPEAPADAEPAGEGEASYYGDEFEGRPTASGEPYAGTRLTAAHRTLPLGSRVRVTNLSTGEDVVVRVNDRGPFAGNRVIDLSKAAAREVGMLAAGTAPVRLELLRGARG